MPKKDSDKPKAARSAYILWSSDNRDKVKNDNPSADAKEIMKLLAKGWKDAPADEKEDFNKRAAEDKLRFQRDLADYKENHPDSDSDKEKKKKKSSGKGSKAGTKRKDPDAPKNAKSAYMYFQDKERAKLKEEGSNLTFGEFGKIIGERWRALSEDKRKPFEDLAKADKARAEQEREDYAHNGGGGKKKTKKARKASSDSDSSSDSSSESESDSSADEKKKKKKPTKKRAPAKKPQKKKKESSSESESESSSSSGSDSD